MKLYVQKYEEKKCGGLNEGNCGLNSISNSDRNP